MKSKFEIQKAHDILHAVILKEDGLNIPLLPNALENVQAIHDCLCWILEHEGGITFENNMKMLQHEIRKRGFIMSQIS